MLQWFMKPKDNLKNAVHFFPDIPDFEKILHLYKQLYLQTPTVSQIREIQKLRNKQDENRFAAA